LSTDMQFNVLNPSTGQYDQMGVMFEPFVAATPGTGLEGFYGSGMLSISGGSPKLGPYTDQDAQARHQNRKSNWHRSEDFCGTCHDVSNTVVGQYAPNHGTQPGAEGNVAIDSFLKALNPEAYSNNPDGLPLRNHNDPDPIMQAASAALGAPLDPPREAYVGLNNPPYAYGIVERTYSEYKSSAFSGMPISKYTDPDPGDPNPLPLELKVTGGALDRAANAAGPTNDDGTPRFFTCQACHMAPLSAAGIGCNKAGTPSRNDLAVHDLTGGNQWVWPLIKYQDANGTLRAGGGLDATQLAAMDAGTIRAENSLRTTVNMEVIGDTLKITNLTGHKAITGYPEGRRMFLEIKWYDATGGLLRHDGEWGQLKNPDGSLVVVNYNDTFGNAKSFTPKSILDLDNTKIYEAHYGMTQAWANILLTVDTVTAETPTPTNYADIVLGYNRITGAAEYTIADLYAGTVPHVTDHETFHFALNNAVLKDNRIPPYKMDYAEAKRRNALPVPDYQYGGDPVNKTPPATYNHWDEHDLAAMAPADAASAVINLNYQGTSWEYVQFMWLAGKCTDVNDPAQAADCSTFLGQQGIAFLDAWVNADAQFGATAPMVPPFTMATATWGAACEPTPEICDDGIDNDCDGLTDADDPDCDVCISTGLPDDNCDGIDDDCNGTADDAYVVTPTSCGVGECAATGQLECQSGVVVDTCTKGTPGTEGPDGDPTCSDTLDNDCDGLTDLLPGLEDPDCQAAVDCTTYDEAQCTADPACRWNKKKGCLNR
jgi:hypothetical protein